MDPQLQIRIEEIRDRLEESTETVRLWEWQDHGAEKYYNLHIRPCEKYLKSKCSAWMKEWDHYLDEEFMAWLFYTLFVIAAIGLQDEEYALMAINYFGHALSLRMLRITKSWDKQPLRDHFLFWQIPNCINILSVTVFYNDRENNAILHQAIPSQMKKTLRLIFSILIALLISAHISVFFLMIGRLRHINNNYSTLKILALAGVNHGSGKWHPKSSKGRQRELTALWSARRTAGASKAFKEFIARSSSPQVAYQEAVVRQYLADFFGFKLTYIPEAWEDARCFVCDIQLQKNDMCCFPLGYKCYALHKGCLATTDFRIIEQMVSYSALVNRMSYKLDTSKLPNTAPAVLRETQVKPAEMVQWDRMLGYEGRIVPESPGIITCL